MEVDLNDEQRILQQTVRQFLKKRSAAVDIAGTRSQIRLAVRSRLLATSCRARVLQRCWCRKTSVAWGASNPFLTSPSWQRRWAEQIAPGPLHAKRRSR